MNDLGDEHRRLRAGLNVGFTAAAVRNCLPVFRKVAETVRISTIQFHARSFQPSPDFGGVGKILEGVDQCLPNPEQRHSWCSQ
jgi:hypothetical protein